MNGSRNVAEARTAVPAGGLAGRAVLAGVVFAVVALVIVLSCGVGVGVGAVGDFFGPASSKSGRSHQRAEKSGGDSGGGDSDGGADSGGGDSGGSDSGDESGGGDSSGGVSSGGVSSGGVSSGGGSGGRATIGPGDSGDGYSLGSGLGLGSGSDAGRPLSAGSGVSARCTVTWTDPRMIARVGQELSARPDATICFRRPGSIGGWDGGGLGSAPGSAAGSVGSALGDTMRDGAGAVSGAASKILSGPPRQVMLHTTGYSFQDNQGGDNATISCGILHKTAGGNGTYNDPITVAVPGHAGQGTETPCGTRFYVPKYEKYFIVEDTGATKYDDAHHIDIYVGGEGGSASASRKCMDPVTTNDGSPIPAIINPPPGRPVQPGAITRGSGCNVG